MGSLTVLGLILLSGCVDLGPVGPDFPGGEHPGQPAATFESVRNLKPGDTAVLTGTLLDRLDSLWVDGVLVSTQFENEGTIRFLVPQLRPCDVDGRWVRIAGSGGTVLHAQLKIPALKLGVGDAAVVDHRALPCLVFPAAEQDYALIATSLRTCRSIERVARFRALHVDGDTVPAPYLHGGENLPLRRESAPIVDLWYPTHPASSIKAAAAAPQPFDPRLPTAVRGDTVRMPIHTSAERSAADVPWYPAEVIAVSGRHVVLLDLRVPNVAQIREHALRFEVAAASIDRYMVPALRGVIDPDFVPLPGAGGRHFTLLTSLPSTMAGTADLLDSRPRSRWRASSEVMIAKLNAALVPLYRPELLASIILHEMTHVADAIESQWHGRPDANGNFDEAVAEMAVEVAFRMSSGRAVGATSTVQSEFAPKYHAIAGSGGGFAGTAHDPYGVLSSMALFVAEHLGNSGIGGSGPLLYQRLQALDGVAATPTEQSRVWGPSGLAALVGWTVEELFSHYALALSTGGRLAANPHGLPQLDAWEYRFPDPDNRPTPTHRGTLSGGVGQNVEVILGAGGHGSYYIRGSAHAGTTVQFDEVTDGPVSFRVVRLR